MVWLLLAFIGLFLETSYVLVSKKFFGDNDSSDTDPVSFASVLFLLVAAIGILYSTLMAREDLFIQYREIITAGHLPIVGINLLLYTIAPYLYWNSLKGTSASETSIFYSFVGVYSAIFSFTFLHSWIGLFGVIGVLLLCGSQVLVSWDKEKGVHFGKFQIFMLIATFCYAGAYLTDSLIMQTGDVSPSAYMVLTFGLPTIALLIMKPKRIRESLDLVRSWDSFKILGLNAVFFFISFLCVYFSYQKGGSAPAVASVLGLESLFIVLIEGLWYKRLTGFRTKLFSACLAVGGVILLSL